MVYSHKSSLLLDKTVVVSYRDIFFSLASIKGTSLTFSSLSRNENTMVSTLHEKKYLVTVYVILWENKSVNFILMYAKK